MKHFILFFSLFLPLYCSGQDLYLRIENALPREISLGWSLNNDDNKYQKSYGYNTDICYDQLWLYCGDKATLSQLLPISALSNYTSLKTIEQVEAEVSGMTVNQVFKWFDAFQNIYIVDILPNGTQIEVSKVELATRLK